MERRPCRGRTVLLGNAHQGQCILGEALAAKARAWMQELASDLTIKPDASGDIVDVSADPLTYISHFIDESELHGHKQVGCV
jgi:hypothetical protein